MIFKTRKYSLLFFIFLLNILTIQGQSGKSSVTFIIDDTGSMSDDIEQVKLEVHRVFDTVVKSAESHVENFILITFNDPDTSLLIDTKDETVFKSHLNSIPVGGGGDCPEYSMTGIELGLKTSLPGSYFYVFTDAAAKDFNKLERIKSLAISKQTQVVFLLTEGCDNNYDDPKYKVYDVLATATSGRVFHMRKTEIGEIMKYIADTVESRKTKIVDKKFKPGYGHTFEYELDHKTNGSSIIISGKEPKGKVTNPDGTINSDPIVNVSEVTIFKTPSMPGKYIAEVGSKSETSVVVMAASKINFQHGFSVFQPTSLVATTIKPIADTKSYLSIALKTDDDHTELKKIIIVDLDDNIILEKPVKPINIKNKFYTSEPFVPPNTIFKVGILAYDPKTNKTIKRFGITPIEPQKPELDPSPENSPPTVTILDGNELSADYGESLKITCKVHGYPQPEIIWENAISFAVLESKTTVLEPPYDYISTLEIDKINENVTYRCKASIDGVVNSKEIEIKTIMMYYFDMIEIPKDLDIEYKRDGTVSCKVDANPPATITWYANGEEIHSDGKNTEISEENSILTIKNMEPHLQGRYMCEVRNEFERNVTNFHVRITGLEKPVISKGTPKINVLKGRSIKLSCRITRGSPTPKMSWILKKDSNLYDLHRNTESFYLEDVTPTHNGVYRCIATNIVGDDYHDIEVTVNYPPEIKSISRNLQAVKGSKPLLICSADGVPTPRVSWLLDDTPVAIDEDHQIYRDNSLRITASEDNSGIYTCVAENKHGIAKRTIQVNYIEPVTIKIPDRSTIDTKVGKNVSLPCHAEGYPKPDIKWVFYSLNPEVRSKILEGEKGTLLLRTIQQDQSGFYTCIANNTGSSGNITYEIKVYAPPVITNAHPDKVYTAVMKDLVLRVPCIATGNPKPKISWYLRSLPVPKGEWYDVEEDGTLVIKNPDNNSGGYYTCRAKNKLGSDQKYFRVAVKRAPDEQVPTSTIVIKENETVPIKCNIPHDKVDMLRWFKNERIIYIGELTINNAQRADTGLYTCRVSNFIESSSSTTKVTVGLAPRFIEDVETEFNYEEGTLIFMDCGVEGEPAPQVSWWHNDDKIDEVGSTYVLQMDTTSLGQYTCVASNEVGSVKRTFTVVVADCLLNIEDEFYGNQPLMVTEDFQLPTYDIFNKYVRVPINEGVILSCPESFNVLRAREVIARCVNESNFDINGKIYKYSDLKCTTLAKPVFRNTGLHCAGPRTESIKVGYLARREFLEVYEVCLDKKKRIPLYTKSTLNWAMAGIESKDAKWTNYESLPYDFNALYDCSNQIHEISFKLGRRFHTDDGCCFAKRQLLSSKDVRPGLPQIATFTNLNIIPQWSTCDWTNWNEVEQRVRNLAKSTSDKLLVWTGTSKQLELPGESYGNTSISISDGTNEQPIPQYIWKVVQNSPTRESLAIIQVNIPDLNSGNKNEHMLCPDICDKIPWMENKAWKDPSRGFVYCCNIRDFERAFGFGKDFSISGDRILYGVSLISVHSVLI
ncbi:hemicentin-2-like [Achroia grisella]|uniref:hemicentin-2-like n=1 Tax=Achroia grisella TaxID=688607 RepID=UPI0027D325A0|nr:hemicentin-2-like [Achroia grisella]